MYTVSRKLMAGSYCQIVGRQSLDELLAFGAYPGLELLDVSLQPSWRFRPGVKPMLRTLVECLLPVLEGPTTVWQAHFSHSASDAPMYILKAEVALKLPHRIASVVKKKESTSSRVRSPKLNSRL